MQRNSPQTDPVELDEHSYRTDFERSGNTKGVVMTVSRRANWFSHTRRARRSARSEVPRTPRYLALAAVALPLWIMCGRELIAAADTKAAIQSVAISKPFFNPSLAENVRVSLSVASGGSLSVLVVDRDGYPVRRLATQQTVQPGRVAYDWDGKDEGGDVVPDEAYSLKIDLESDGQSSQYFPANAPGIQLSATTNYYDRQGAVLSYTLPAPARVHIQAGLAKPNAKTGVRDGPVLATLVNRAPRPGGPVIENWNGLDEGNGFYIPDLPDFAVGIAATSLPENSVITFGNRKVTFLEAAISRQGSSLLTVVASKHAHHAGLTTLDDVAPRLNATLLNASWSSIDRTWTANQRDLQVSLSLAGPSAAAFAKHPAHLGIFFDEHRIQQVDSPRPGMTLQVKLPKSRPGAHVLAFNWASEFGPVAVDAVRISKVGGSSSPVAPRASAGR